MPVREAAPGGAGVRPLHPEFIRTIEGSFEGAGKRWLAALPGLLEVAAHRWNLADIRPVHNLSYNYVAFATRGASAGGPSGRAEVVLKMGVPNRELTGEVAALRLYDGRGACRLLEADAGKGMLLLERLEPGHMLATLEEDDCATGIAAEVINRLWECSRTADRAAKISAAPGFLRLEDWFCGGFERLRSRFNGGTGPLPAHLVARAESLSEELLNGNEDEVVLHGDLHHFNVLASARGWLAIDPKGVIGPAGYEAGPFLLNPRPALLQRDDPKGQLRRRVAILSERLRLDQGTILAWGFCHATLSACWCLEEDDMDCAEYSLRCAELLEGMLKRTGLH